MCPVTYMRVAARGSRNHAPLSNASRSLTACPLSSDARARPRLPSAHPPKPASLSRARPLRSRCVQRARRAFSASAAHS
eukprot:5242717-Prymnesium_polylepis.1